MILEQMDVQPEDRILLLSIPEIAWLIKLAGRLGSGGVVALGNREDVYAARRAAACHANVMIHPGPPEEIPFSDGFFSKVAGSHAGWRNPARVAAEVARVLSPGGFAFLVTSELGLFADCGLVQVGSVDDWIVFNKPPNNNLQAAQEPFSILR